jgi:hypothetical protein
MQTLSSILNGDCRLEKSIAAIVFASIASVKQRVVDLRYFPLT